jgi:hypothetical protein
MSIKETYGFELESYGLEDTHLGYHDHKEEIENVFHDHGCGEFIETVKGDGSLSDYGFEINCGIFEGIKDMKGALNHVIEVCNEENFIPRSPCALHIHIGGHSKPLNFSILSHMFDQVYGMILNNNNNSLMWGNKVLRTPRGPDIIKCENTSQFRRMLERLPISGGRGYTLRNRCNRTIEFRAIPLRINPTYIKGWMKIYEGIKKRANHMSYEKVLKLNENVLGGDLNHKIEVLSDICGLTDYELFVLFHKINDKTKEKWDILKKEKYQYTDIVRGELLDLENINSNVLMDTLNMEGIRHYTRIIDGEVVYFPQSFNSSCYPQSSTSTHERRRAISTITLNNGWGRLNRDGFVFRDTNPIRMLNHLKGLGLIEREIN